LGIGDWAQSPIPNPQSPIPNPQSPYKIHQLQKIILKIEKNYNLFKRNKITKNIEILNQIRKSFINTFLNEYIN
jgi:hypothetical protein